MSTLTIEQIESLIDGTEDRWFDMHAAVKHTTLSHSTLRRAIKSGDLNASKVTGKILFKESDINRWLEGAM